MNSELFVN